MERLPTSRRATLVLAGVLVAVMIVWPVLLGRRVPLLGWIDLAIHEAGHVFFLWAPHDVMLVMGNGTQFLLPLIVAVAFLFQERDLAGGAVGLAWAGQNLFDAAVYVADAPHRQLPLLGPESSHDWWQLLGRHGWLDVADELALLLRVLGAGFLLLSVAVLVVAWNGDEAWRQDGVLVLPWRAAPGSRASTPAAHQVTALDHPVDVAEDPPTSRVIW